MQCRVHFLLVGLAALLVTACTGHGQSSTSQSNNVQAIGAASDGCAGQPSISSLPVWAQSGFRPPDVAMPHVTGAAGNIVAVLWSPKNALHSPPLPNRANKILWISKVPLAAPLVIQATLAGSTRAATVSLTSGPGPSYIDLPAPGCWTLHLSWGGHTDQLMLRYTS